MASLYQDMVPELIAYQIYIHSIAQQGIQVSIWLHYHIEFR